MWLFTFILFIGIFSQNSNQSPDHVKFPLNEIPIELKSVSCSGGNSSCPSRETCCQLESGEDSCCPLREGVCCNDHLHCCPNGYQCDVEHSRCQKEFKQSHNVVCPDGEMSCADGETCCKSQFVEYGCCPLPDAVSCSDSIHCCPHGYRCNIEEKKCEKGISIPWFTRKAATPLDLPSKLILSSSLSSSLSTIQCSDQNSVCSEETTCCELNNGTYGCCPYHQASCCSDKIHCCGEGYSCDQSGSRCIRHLSLIPLTIVEEQTCPDGITKCSSSSTCCPNKDKNDHQISYSCCPYARGVCCGSSCCPSKYICDENHLTCELNETSSIENEAFNECGSSDVVNLFSEIFHIRSLPPSLTQQNCAGNQELCRHTNICCPSGHCDPIIARCI